MDCLDDFFNKIIFGDCLEVMSSIPDECIDMILCDLPYGITARNSWDNIIPLKELWSQYERIVKKSAAIVLTSVQPFTSKLVMSNLQLFRYDWVWRKNKKTGFLNASKMPLRQHESILVFYKRLPVYNPQKTVGHTPVNSYIKHTSDGLNYGKTKKGIQGGGQTDRYPSSVLEASVVNNYSKKRCHPTQKLVALFRYLVNTYTDEEMLVLDNCIGSGTTAIACLSTNRRFIGIENNFTYYELALKRVEQYKIKRLEGIK